MIFDKIEIGSIISSINLSCRNSSFPIIRVNVREPWNWLRKLQKRTTELVVDTHGLSIADASRLYREENTWRSWRFEDLTDLYYLGIAKDFNAEESPSCDIVKFYRNREERVELVCAYEERSSVDHVREVREWLLHLNRAWTDHLFARASKSLDAGEAVVFNSLDPGFFGLHVSPDHVSLSDASIDVSQWGDRMRCAPHETEVAVEGDRIRISRSLDFVSSDDRGAFDFHRDTLANASVFQRLVRERYRIDQSEGSVSRG